MTVEATADAAVSAGPPPARHPLDPLTADELVRSRDLIAAAGLLGDATRVALVQLQEPLKEQLAAWSPGAPLDRHTFTVLLDGDTGTVTEVVVALDEGRIVSTREVSTREHPYGQPGLVANELLVLDEIVKAEPRWQAAMRARGISDLSTCKVLPLSAGQFALPDEAGRRLMRAITLYQEQPTDIPWLRPIEGVIATVDLIERRIIAFADHGGPPIPPRHPNFAEGAWGPTRDTLRPLAITQPEGPSFTVDGAAVDWEGWSFRVGFDAREGLVLHQLGFRDGDRVRPIIHRASISEMVVPYADPHPMRFWISYFDEGEYGLGRLAASLTLGCDCLGYIHYFDAVYADDRGNPVTLPRAVCMHEEDVGVLWKHQDHFSGTSEVRRSRRLVVSFWAAIGNYDYGFFWYLYQDGTIELDVKLTGIVFSVATPEPGPYATQVTPELAAPYHQHLFNARLDVDVDGTANTVEEVDVVPVEDEAENPYGNAFTTRVTVIERESEAARLADASRSRRWRIVNRGRTNHVGNPVGYELVPASNPVLLARPGSSVAERAAFATRHLWVTRADPAERYAAGPYPNQHAGGAGLPAYQAADRDLVDTDVVVWHTFGCTHVPRSEDWPVMPVEHTGFHLRPVNFFDRNPTLDLPRSSPGAECSVQHGDGTGNGHGHACH
jgi:primary-amine oxidase